MNTVYPGIGRSNDKRFKLTPENEREIIDLRQAGNTYQYIANKFGVHFHTIYYLCQKFFTPDVWEKRTLARRKAQSKINQAKPLEVKRQVSKKMRHRLIDVLGSRIRNYDNTRNTERYHRSSEQQKLERNTRRRISYQQRKALKAK
jgi:hypothetical protein